MFLRTILAAIPAVLMPLTAISQAAPAGESTAGQAEANYKYDVYAGFGYTSLNQVNQSRYGLMGVNLSLTRDFGKYFGMSGLINYYKPPLGGSNGANGNPGDPSIYEVLVGPEIHAVIYEKVSGFVHGGLGVEHTGGESETPNLSFAGGFGGGMSYNLNSRLSVRASGDRIGASFSLRNNTSELGNSPHRTWNASGTIGVVYHF